MTEPKRSQKPKRPLSQFLLPNGYSFSLTALWAESVTKLPRDKPTGTRALLWDVCECGWEGVAVRSTLASVGPIAATVPRSEAAPRFSMKFTFAPFGENIS